VLIGYLIEHKHYVPGTDFIDPALPANLNVGARKIKLLLDSSVHDGVNAVFAGPLELGFTLAGAPDFLFRGNMESLTPSPN